MKIEKFGEKKKQKLQMKIRRIKKLYSNFIPIRYTVKMKYKR